MTPFFKAIKEQQEMRDEAEKVWKAEGRIGGVFKFDYDCLLKLIPNDVNFKKSDLYPKKNKQIEE